MNTLKQIVTLITKYKLQKVNVLDDYCQPTDNYQMFYEAIRTNRLHTDTKAAQHFFNDDAESKAYQRFKREFFSD